MAKLMYRFGGGLTDLGAEWMNWERDELDLWDDEMNNTMDRDIRHEINNRFYNGDYGWNWMSWTHG